MKVQTDLDGLCAMLPRFRALFPQDNEGATILKIC